MPIRSRWTDQFSELPNQSKFHEKVRQILCNDWWRNYRAYQEVPVAEVCDYYDNRHRFDWYIPDLNLVIELHGQQHYHLTNRGNVGAAQAERDFKEGRARDHMKKLAAEEAGYKYVEISYKEYTKLDSQRLKELALNE